MAFTMASSALSLNVGAPAGVVVRSPTVLMNSEAAKAAWLARQSKPSWSPARASAPPSAPMASAPMASAPMAMASASEDAAKAAWLDKQDTPAWGPAKAAAPAPVDIPTTPAVSSVEDAAKQAWLAKHDLAFGGSQRSGVTSEAAAKAAWLAKQDVPSWGKGAAATAAVEFADPAAAAPTFAPTTEEQAKAAWLAKQDVAFGGSQRGHRATPEDAAKAAWLARQELSSWGPSALPSAPPAPTDAAPVAAAPFDYVGTSEEDVARVAWLARQDLPTTTPAKRDAPQPAGWQWCPPRWQWPASVFGAAGTEAATAPAAWMSEDAAKQAWLTQQEPTPWGAYDMPGAVQLTGGAFVPVPAALEMVVAAPGAASEVAAGVAWLAHQPPPTSNGAPDDPFAWAR